MRKLFSLLAIAIVLCAFVGCSGKADQAKAGDVEESKADTIYFLTPTATHGWMGQCGAYAARLVKEINAEGKYKAYHYTAAAGTSTNDQVDEILANGDALASIVCAFDDDAASGEMKLTDAGIPWISFARIIDSTVPYALVNISGDNKATGAMCAAWLVERGFAPGDTLVQFTGSTSTDATWRSDAFIDFLTGNYEFKDAATDKTYKITDVYDRAWTEEEAKALKTGNSFFNYVCNWSNDIAKGFIESDMQTWLASAESTGGAIYVNSQDDEMTMALLESLDSNVFNEDVKKRIEAIDLYATAVGGMEELYAVMRGEDQSLTPIMETYFEDIMSVYMSPGMMLDAGKFILEYLDDPENFRFTTGDTYYPDPWYVDRTNAKDHKGFDGRGN